MKKIEKRRSDMITELIRTYSRKGELTSASKNSIAEKLGLPVTAVEQTATFYPNLFSPRAKYRIILCKSLSCSMGKSTAVYKALKKELHIKKNGVSSDGKYSLTLVNCLGLCDEGPAMMVNDRTYTGLYPTKALIILLKREINKNSL